MINVIMHLFKSVHVLCINDMWNFWKYICIVQIWFRVRLYFRSDPPAKMQWDMIFNTVCDLENIDDFQMNWTKRGSTHWVEGTSGRFSPWQQTSERQGKFIYIVLFIHNAYSKCFTKQHRHTIKWNNKISWIEVIK